MEAAAKQLINTATGQSGFMESLTFEKIYAAYSDRILNLAYRMTGSAEEARDLTQDIFVRVYENLDSLRGDSMVYTWLYRVATNFILNHLKKSGRRKWLAWMDLSVKDAFTMEKEDNEMSLAEPPERPDGHLEKSQREQLVWNAICQLKPKYRIPLILNRYEEMSYNEIAEVMDISLSAVESRLHRAKKSLVEILTPMIHQL